MTRDRSGGEVKPKAESRHKVALMDACGEIFPFGSSAETSLIFSSD